jgi:hypothetical protein
MPLAEDDLSRCEQCGAKLDSALSVYGCLNCLLLGCPNESLEGLQHNRWFQHYEVSVLADGVSLWELGRGAMGITYHALDMNLGSPVALKVISVRYSAIPERASASGEKRGPPRNCATRTSRQYFILAKLRQVSVFMPWIWWKGRRWKRGSVVTDHCPSRQCWMLQNK